MNEKFLKLANKIVKDEKLLNEIVKADTFDELYDIITSTQFNFNISKKELKDFVNKYTEELNNEQLSEVAGGVKDLKGKIMPSAVASILSFLTMAQTGVSAVGNEVPSSPTVSVSASTKEPQGKSLVSRNIGKLTLGVGVGAVACLGLIKVLGPCLTKSNKMSKYEKSLRGKSKDELISMLPDAFRDFYAAGDAVVNLDRKINGPTLRNLDCDVAGFAVDDACGDSVSQYIDFYNCHIASGQWKAQKAVRDANFDSISHHSQTAHVAAAAAYQAAIKAAGDDKAAIRKAEADFDAADAAADAAETKAFRVKDREEAAMYQADAAVARRKIIATWEKGGAAYDIVKNNPPEYFSHLLAVLKEQTDKLNDIVARSQAH